jgi:CRISPR-associated protein Csd1
MYLRTPIRWLIDIDEEGRFVGFVKTEGSGRSNDRGKEFFAPHRAISSNIAPKLLAHNGEYVLGIARETKKLTRVLECHRAFVEQIRDCAEKTKHPSVGAVLKFLEGNERPTTPAEFTPKDVLTFRVNGVMPIELDEVRAYWAEEAREAGKADLAQCLVCGQNRPPLRNIPFKIKRIPGGQTSGTALISTNRPAFESYGLDAISCAPICGACGEQFSKAANSLIEGENTHLKVGPLVYIFWTREGAEWSPVSILSNPDPDEVRALMASAFAGHKEALNSDSNNFYATAFSASGGRAVVRDWLETTVPQVKANLARYFALQEIVDRDGALGRPFGLYALSAATVRDANKELRPEIPRAILRVALKGGALPLYLLAQAIGRNRAEQRVTRSRVSLIKMVLLSNQTNYSLGDSAMVQLDPTIREPAYLCGRLLAVLERIQQAAIPGANATITDRFFGTASSAPASVFGRLLRGSQAHLSKLRKERPGTHRALKQRLEEVLFPGLESFPKLLTMQQQGLFSLGYFHQCAQDRAAAIAHKQKKSEATETESNAK